MAPVPLNLACDPLYSVQASPRAQEGALPQGHLGLELGV